MLNHYCVRLTRTLRCKGELCWSGIQTCSHGGGGAKFVPARGFPTSPTTVSMEALRARQPPHLLRNDVYQMVPPQDITPQDLADLASNKVLTDPAAVLRIYRRHASGGETPDPVVLIRAMAQLGFLFDPNSFFSSADRQILTSHKHFRALAHDLAHAGPQLPAAAAPVLLYAMACLEYRCGPLMPFLLAKVIDNLTSWRHEVLTLLLHSVASLGLGCSNSATEIRFDLGDGTMSEDYSYVCRLLAEELGRRITGASGDSSLASEDSSLHDWARAAFAVVMADMYDLPVSPHGPPLLAALLERASGQVSGRQELDGSGWAQFFLYQTLYCTDVERPASEELVKRAVPMWIQERLHERWLDEIVLQSQPQGADKMLQDVDKCLRRTNTQALLNCSAGRDWDEQHCWFAGFLLKPRIALECDSMLPLGPGRPRPSGWLALKSRLLRKMSFKVVTIHRCFWDKLTDDQKDDQLLRLRVDVGYEHDKDLERRQRNIRQTAFQRGEYATKSWAPLPSGPGEEADASDAASAGS